jgi:hypothetical protein
MGDALMHPIGNKSHGIGTTGGGSDEGGGGKTSASVGKLVWCTRGPIEGL